MISKTSFFVLCGVVSMGSLIATAQDQDLEEQAKAIATTPLTTADSMKGGIEITSTKEAAFDSEESLAVFLGDVKVIDEKFQLTADKLTVYMDKEKGGLKQAIAEGEVVIIQDSEPDEKGRTERSIGRAERAVYEPQKGIVTLIGWPEIQQGINLHKATVATTKMVLNPDGRMKTFGKSKTVIQERDVN